MVKVFFESKDMLHFNRELSALEGSSMMFMLDFTTSLKYEGGFLIAQCIFKYDITFQGTFFLYWI